MTVIIEGTWKPRIVGDLGPRQIEVERDLSGLTPTVTVWDAATDTVVVNAAACTAQLVSPAPGPLSTITWHPTAPDVAAEGEYYALFSVTIDALPRKLGHIRYRLDSAGPPF